ncbi:type II toxin-antitoxin system death-on-curing family toxin [Pleomorphomonas sp. NRK KF1]|uniref:type II toxin-antitoxin system death-on-curing family toxin n=1 Tax=Pleomorphomonas sp. NRK KF1 TaxID=2943000 RepID=UPI0020445510|nr:type II toxin-antitoxin system death-on-curing family toxin [Pleomorphomonas sp. NRK KF1]MCM5555877.1 type II toxin-antitoxin system death-on-curing family toxin [Pleomorphomonas sp. NRK KF1]
MSDFLTTIEVLAILEDQVERYGGIAGVRDPGLLEAALFRPQTGYYADLIEEAAALWESLAQNHPFLDGNKRVAFAATYTFLAINGTFITAGADETFAFIDGLYRSGHFEFGQLVAWLRANTTERR